MGHILERFLIHFVASTFVTLAVFYLLRYWGMRNCKVGQFISGRKSHLLVTAALIVFALAPLREPFDIAAGQVWYKAVTDQISWMLGAAVSAWGLYRFAKFGD